MESFTPRNHLRFVLSFALIALLPGLFFLPSSSAAAAPPKTVRMFGVEYVKARDLAARFGLTPSWLSPQKTMRLKSRWTTLDLTIHSIEAELNGVSLFLSEPVVVRGTELYLGARDADNILAPILQPRTAKKLGPVRTIVIDPGHGGVDPGNQNRRLKLKEKTYTLDVAQRLERLLKADGYRVILTRRKDQTVELDDRTRLANRARADLFISIHFNAFSDHRVAGTETYVMTPRHQRSSPQAERDRSMMRTAYPSNKYDDFNVSLGYQVHRSLVHSLKSVDRGLKRFRYSVLRSINCPAVLVEAAFLSNDAEGRKVSGAHYRQQIAESIATGVKRHVSLHHSKPRKS
jgi:N-acetylmuramoyl-L-alanine amidase